MKVGSKYLIVIAGPTAVGKTDLCVELAQYFEVPVISADSRQFFKEMSIGTAKPSIAEMQGVVHYFINSHSIAEPFNAGLYSEEALKLIDHLFTEKDYLILTGGSGLYIKAVCEGFDEMPQVEEETRNQLVSELSDNGLSPLLEELKKSDPVYYEQVDKANHQRILRALEVIRSTGVPFSFYRKNEKASRNFEIIKIGLERPREELYERINRRMDFMLEAGLEDEVKALIQYKSMNALQTVGYKEVFDFFDGIYDREEMIRLLKRNSRRYAKRQLTWFKKDKEYRWFNPVQKAEIIDFIEAESGRQKA
ncbi:MAG: tRNA (adenosine(37)-N6)-dimethylallyltransferase MiaA [Sporocytophaga sp.]|nr:tRNA (adenosine(37)-N6)-dimethylallyltransferase MiaA [Sporocytophaga sp.]MBO9700884.1 tRNA (adenosine(37)-N6)-dimethylallyltransferase MiaA [Sporocytophaga sp.]